MEGAAARARLPTLCRRCRVCDHDKVITGSDMRMPSFFLIMAASPLVLVGCTTQRIWLRNPTTNQTASCGANPLAPGQFSSLLDAPCVRDFEMKGWVRFQPTYCISISYCRGRDL